MMTPDKAIVSFATFTRMLRLRLRTAHGKRYVIEIEVLISVSNSAE